jgi:hypothetical protein
MRRRRFGVRLVAGLALAAIAAAARGELFTAAEPLDFRLELPLRTVVSDREERDYQPARIAVAGTQGEISVDLRVRLRGKSRVEACEFPPLLLNFRSSQPEGSPFAGENRLKLVTHCGSSAANEQYVRLERQLYLVLGLFTETSLRTRLVNVTYFDTERGRELGTKVGFLIEDEERFAERMGLTPVTAERVDSARYDPDALAVVDVFQYFIGNTDWSAIAGPAGEQCCHNVVPFARADGVLVPVPYDFDASGIVDTPYSMPDERLPIQDVRQRLYRGRCRELADLQPTFAQFVAQREAITALFTPAVGLTERTVQRTRAYVDDFYEAIADSARAERAFRARCSR